MTRGMVAADGIYANQHKPQKSMINLMVARCKVGSLLKIDTGI